MFFNSPSYCHRSPRFSDYVNFRKINEGASSIVYSAEHRRTRSKVAVKVIRSRGSMDVQMFRSEIHLLKKVKSANITQFYESFSHENNLVIVLELIEGKNLEDGIQYYQERAILFSEKKIWYIFHQICSGLKVLHEKMILHRDLKSANIFVTENLDIKIGDLGLACLLDGRSLEGDGIVGTLYYVAPEKTTRENYGFPSDIWSLGCLLYELATLVTPFFGEICNEYALIKKIRECDMVPFANNVYSKQLHYFVNSCLALNPDDRPNAEEAYEAARLMMVKFQSLASHHCSNNNNRH